MSVAALLLFSQCAGGGKGGDGKDGNTAQTITTTTEPNAAIDNNPATLAVRPPIQGVDIPKTRHTVNGAKGGVIKMPSGTTITIAPNIFVDKNGQPITEDVEIEYREMHNAAEMLISGIPTYRPETGEYMETAGMFEINGSYKGEEIFVAQGKHIDVKMASFNEGNNFDFWALNPKDCSWADIDGIKDGAIPGKPNKERADAIARLERVTPPAPVAPTNPKLVKNPVFDLDVNYRAMPELAPFKNVTWEFCGKSDKENPDKNEWVFDTEWDKIDLQRGNGDGYTLVLSNKEKTFKSTVRPILSEKDFAKAMEAFDKKLDQYQNIIETQKAERERLAQQAALYREMSIEGFGIYNWDIMHFPNVELTELMLTFNDAELQNTPSNKMQVYLVGNKALLPVFIDGNKKASKLRYSFNTPFTRIVAIVDGKKVVSAPFNQSNFYKQGGKDFAKAAFNAPAISIERVEDAVKYLNS